MNEKITNIERMRQEHATVRTQVLNLIGWDELQYGLFQEEMGKEFLRSWFGDGVPLVDDLPNHKEFWSWWKLHWVKRDREFLEMSGLLFPHELQDYYRETHDPHGVQFYPHGSILEATYEAMIHRLIKAAVK